MAASTDRTTADPCTDAQALSAALSAAGDWDRELSVLFGLETLDSSSSSSSSSSDHKPQRAKRKARVGQRLYRETRSTRRLEIAVLKAQVEELQYQVAQQKAPEGKDVTKAAAVQAAEEEREWQRVASSRQRLCFAAELENANLRRRTETQLKMAKQIDKLSKRLMILEEALGPPPGVSLTGYSGPRIDPRDHLKRLDAMVADANNIFGVDRFSRSSHPCFREMYFRDGTPAEGGVEYEYSAVWMLPFSLERVVEALWAQTIRPAYERKTHAYKDIYKDTDSTVSRLIATPAAKDWWGPCHHQAAARRLSVGDGSSLIVGKLIGQAINDDKWHAIANFETWLRVENVPTPARASPITVVKLYQRTLLRLPESAAFSKAERCKWAQTLFASHSQTRFEKELDWILQVLDNLLLTPGAAANRIRPTQGITVQPPSVPV